MIIRVRVKILGTILRGIKRKWENQFEKTDLWVEGKQEIFCMQDGQAIKIISQTHHIKIKRRNGEIKDDVW
jgi:hypothetical protein